MESLGVEKDRLTKRLKQNPLLTVCVLPLVWIHRITVFLILQVGAAAGK